MKLNKDKKVTNSYYSVRIPVIVRVTDQHFPKHMVYVLATIIINIEIHTITYVSDGGP